MIEIIIPDPPVCWKAHAGYGRRSFNPLWREREFVREHVRRQYSGPLIAYQISVDYLFYLAIPKSISKKMKAKMLDGTIRPTGRGDRDNMAKFLSDALQEVLVANDKFMVDGRIGKWYSETPQTVIHVSRT